MQRSRYTELFRSESREHIETLNHLLLALETDPSSSEPVEEIFRAVHTLKGMAATMGYDGVAEIAHEVETVLERLRRNRQPAPSRVVEVLLRAADALEDGIERCCEESGAPAAPPAVLAELRALAVDRVQVEPSAPTPHAVDRPRAEPEPTAAEHGYRVRARIAPDAALPGVRAFMLLRAARQLGDVSGVVPEEAALHQPEFKGELAFVLHTAEGGDALRQRLSAVGDLDELALAALVAEPEPGPFTPVPLAATLPPLPRTSAVARHIRVDAARLDTLMDRVGELVILRDRLVRTAAGRGSDDFAEPVEQIARLVGELRDEVLGLRMVAVREIFGRYSRVVRDAAHALDKRIDLVIEGDDTEMDRSVVERVGDPLVHLLRNAVDHGIESPAERIAQGKPATGRVHLSAHREPNRLLIRLADDGRGIDCRRVARKAVELGLVAGPAAAVSDEEALDLITRPGLSTADRVTDVSGRGVGLDIVATQIRSLGGTLDISTRVGEGTVFSLRLPLTVGLMRVLLVAVGGCTYAVPVAHVAETVEIPTGAVHGVTGRRIALLRGEALPLIRLADVLRHDEAAARERIVTVVLETEDQRVGLEVGALVGQQEVVTKPFDAPRGTLPLFAGATILTDGSPALMLDAAALIRLSRTPVSTRVRTDEPC